MAKKILTLVFIAFLTNSAFGQSCTPDISINTHGYYPDKLDTAQETVAYNMTMQVYSKRDTMVDNPLGGGKVNATIDSIIITSVLGLPPGLAFICNPSNCRFVSLKTHCINIYGTPPQGSSMYYPLDIKATAKVTVGGSYKTTVNESITDFGIFVKDDHISSVETVNNNSMAVYPNPASACFNMYNKRAVEGVVRIYSSTGTLVLEQIVLPNEEIKIGTISWPMSVYYIQTTYKDGLSVNANVLIK